jgi:hypothetical protein
VEVLFDGKGNHYPHISPSIVVFAGLEKASTNQKLQMDGVFEKKSSSHQV